MIGLKWIIGAAALLLVSVPLEPRAESPTGEELVKQFWAAVKADDIGQLDQLLANAFQSAHDDGARDKAQELDLAKKDDISDYTLSDFKVTQQGPAIVVTYFGEVAETINDKRLPKKKAARITVFLKTGKGWQIIAHANLNPLKQ